MSLSSDSESPKEKNIDIEDQIAHHIHEIIKLIGEDPQRQGLRKTPHRFARAMTSLTQGYHMDLETIVNGAVFDIKEDMVPPNESDNSVQRKDSISSMDLDLHNMVIIKDIPIYSLCEHHLLPFHGVVHIAYIPKKKVLGLSKFARIVEIYSKQLQIQERLCDEIAHGIKKVIDPLGVGVIVKASHMCMEMRGVQKSGSSTITSCVLGYFRSSPKTRAEFMTLINS